MNQAFLWNDAVFDNGVGSVLGVILQVSIATSVRVWYSKPSQSFLPFRFMIKLSLFCLSTFRLWIYFTLSKGHLLRECRDLYLIVQVNYIYGIKE